MARTFLGLTLLASTILAGGPAHAHDHAAQGKLKQLAASAHVTSAASGRTDVQLWDGLDGVSYRITTSDPLAQRYFNQGLIFAYGFNHWEAQRSFRAAQALDPNCAMCFWGEALVLGSNINAPMEAAAVGPAWAAIREAKRLAKQASEKEQALIAALMARYSPDPESDRVILNQAFADAMEEVAARFPDDLDIATLYAEALMDLSPWDYWTDGGKTPTNRSAEIVAVLERVLAADPANIGASHLYIHAVEASDRPERAEAYADRLAALPLSTGHLVHMPSHIYFRVGRYTDSLAVNKAAVALDEAYLAAVDAEGIYPVGYYPHNIHFVLVSAQMAGDGATAISAAEKLDRAVTAEAARAFPIAQPIKAAPLFAHAQFSPPETVLKLPAPPSDLPYVKAMWHYARGVAQAANSDIAAARAEADAIAAIGGTADFSALVEGGVPAPDVLRVAHRVVLARIAQADGNLDAAIREFEAAYEVERALPYMEPAFWYYPVQQSLGAALLLAGETDRAEEVFRASLDAAPNNGWSCFGLLEVQKRRGNEEEAAKLEERLDRTWAGDPALLDLNRL